jgi:hypothetical protein
MTEKPMSLKKKRKEFPCDHCYNDEILCIPQPNACSKIEEIKAWKESFEDLLDEAAADFREENAKRVMRSKGVSDKEVSEFLGHEDNGGDIYEAGFLMGALYEKQKSLRDVFGAPSRESPDRGGGAGPIQPQKKESVLVRLSRILSDEELKELLVDAALTVDPLSQELMKREAAPAPDSGKALRNSLVRVANQVAIQAALKDRSSSSTEETEEESQK